MVISATIILWLFFIITSKVADGAQSRDDLNLIQKVFVFAFVVVDVLYNYTFGSILFWEIADNDRKTLTARLKHILHSGFYKKYEWRFRLALFMCKYMISPWDWNHCGLGFGKK